MARKAADPNSSYGRRIARALAKGYSLSQARGHPRAAKGERSIRDIKAKSLPPPLAAPGTASTPAGKAFLFDQRAKPDTIEKAFRAVDLMRGGRSQRAAARDVGLPESTLRRVIARKHLKDYATGVQSFWTKLPLVTVDGRLVNPSLDPEAAALAGRYLNDAKWARRRGDPSRLDPYRGLRVRDAVTGEWFYLSTDMNLIHDVLGQTDRDDLERMYASDQRDRPDDDYDMAA